MLNNDGILLTGSTLQFVATEMTCIAPVIYILLTLAAIASLSSPLLSQLALHGKTRIHHVFDENAKKEINAVRVEKSFFARFTKFSNHARFQVSKRHFFHFYLTGTIWAVFILWDQSGNNWVHYLLYIHLIRRCYECRFVHKWNGTMHIAGFALGMLHYILLPYVFISARKDDNNDDKQELVLNIMGTLLNLFAQYEQNFHHRILAHCRNDDKQRGICYSIPRGRWFQFVSCPHYFAEVIIYFSFGILLHSMIGNYSSVAMADERDRTPVETLRVACFILEPFKHAILFLWVTVNLAVSAKSSHKWYKRQFPSYPKSRKALIPFLA